MWICGDSGTSAYNLAHVTRLYVEETGQGAALKAEIAGRTYMIGYFNSKPEAKAMLLSILEKQDAGATLLRV